MRSFSLARLTAPGLDALAEGSLVWLVYVSFAGRESVAPLGLLEFVLGAACGVALARTVNVPLVLAGGALAAGGVAWLADPVTREALATNGVPTALLGTMPNWLIGAAVLRGGVHRQPEHDDDTLVRVLGLGVVFLVLPWLLHPGGSSGAFAASVILGSVVFLASALLALAHGRLSALGLDPSASEGGRAWRIVAAPVTLLLVVIALVAAFIIGAPFTAIATALAGPLALALGGVLGAAVALLSPAIDAGGRLIPSLPRLPGMAPVPSGTASAAGASGGGSVGLPHELIVAVVLMAIGAALALLVRYRWVFSVPRPPKFPPASAEDRDRLLPHLSLRVRMPAFSSTFSRRPKKPHTAVEAYLAVLRELEHRPEVARLDAESPAQHALRVRDRGLADTQLALLAADFQLSAYGNRALSSREERRALDRWLRLMAAVRSRRSSRVH